MAQIPTGTLRAGLQRLGNKIGTSAWRFPEARKRFFREVWRQPRRIISWLVAVAAIIAVFVAMVFLILYGYRFSFTGFNAPPAANPQQPPTAKTLWDWLNLLVVPAVLAVGGFLFNRFLDQRSKSIAADQQREDAWQGYLDKMSELLTTQQLKESKPDSPVRNVATARTLAVLPGLDPIRKGRVLRFLYDSGLIFKHDRNSPHDHNPIVKLSGANFSNINIHETKLDKRYVQETGSRISLRGADLQGAIFRDASLQQIDLREACLDGAYISQADLHGTWFCQASMIKIRLYSSNLYRACLQKTLMYGADLRLAYLREADLREAHLEATKIHEQDVEAAKLTGANLQGALLYRPYMNSEQQKIAQNAGAVFENFPDPKTSTHTCGESSAAVSSSLA